RELGDRTGEAQTLYGIARVERERGNLDAARAKIEDALKIVELVRSKVLSRDLRISFFASLQDYYEFYIDLLMQQQSRSGSSDYSAAALEAGERARARSLLELLYESRADIREGADPALLERERDLRERININADKLLRIKSRKHTQADVDTAEKDIRDLTSEFDRLMAEIRQKSPRYAAVTQPQPLTLKEIQRLLAPDILLLEYQLGKERSFLWAVTQDSIKSYELPSRSEVEAAA